MVAISILILTAACKAKDQAPQSRDSLAREEQPAMPPTPALSDLDEAVRLYTNAASPTDNDTAVKVFYKFAYLNDPQGQYYLGLARWDGKGAEQSDLEAYVWWTIAARQQHQESINRIKDVKSRFTQEWQEEITNRANDWEVKVQATPEMQPSRK